MAPPRTTVSDLAAAEGELSFTVAGTFGERTVRFWGDIPQDLPGSGETSLAAALLPAMTQGGELSLPTPLSPRLRAALPDLQGALQGLALASPYVDQPLRRVELAAPRAGGAGVDSNRAGSGTALFFSGGVDSLTTLLLEPGITDLVYVHGFDIPVGEEEVSAVVERRLAEIAGRRGLPLHVIRTDLRALLDPLIGWEISHGPALAAIAHLLSPLCERVLIASSVSYLGIPNRGSHPLVDPLWSSERCRLVHHAAYLGRAEKVELLAEHQDALDVLRVCWRRPDRYNCGRCEKCLRTMTALDAVGALDRCPTFSVPLDLDAVAAVRLAESEQAAWWKENLALARRRGARRELVEALETCLEANPAELLMNEVELRAELIETRRHLGLVLGSNSWKLTAPLRKLGATARRLKGR